MRNLPTSAEINSLFANSDSGTVWTKAVHTLHCISPDYDTSRMQLVFDDVISLFRGEYPGYSSIKTLYHDKPHTLNVFLCAVRLMHGMHVSGNHLTDEEITLIMIAVLMHDIGYAQREGEESGTGAQYTQTHVKRGVAFMKSYIVDHYLPVNYIPALDAMISCTDPALEFSRIHFPNERIRLLGQIVVTADLVGQMADRTYLEKLLFLYLEFKEANFGNYQSIHDLLRQTQNFYKATLAKLEGPFGGLYTQLTHHFKEVLEVGENYYLQSIQKNMAYLAKIVERDEDEYLPMLKRGGIVERSQTLAMM